MQDVSYWRNRVEQLRGRHKALSGMLEKAKEEADDYETHAHNCEEALTIVRHVAQETQKQLEYQISELVSLAMYSVFDNPYEFEVEFVQRRNRTEADIWFRRGDQRISPIDASGGGAVDVAAFALRVALWNLSIPRTANVLILDEPLKWLKGGDLPEKGAQMIQELSDKLGLQIIMISHIPDQIEGSDKQIHIEMKKGVSYAS